MRSAQASSSAKSLSAVAFMLWRAANFPHLESAAGQSRRSDDVPATSAFAPRERTSSARPIRSEKCH